jgi:hypothetical protein
MSKRNTLADFWTRVKRGPGCWLWVARLDRYGYGVFRLNGKTRKAHRVAYAAARGEPDGALFVCHRCDVRACVNPAHLFLGTNADNTADRQRKGRQAVGERTRPETRARGEANGWSKLTRRDVRRIRAMADRAVLRQRDIGVRFGVTQGVVSKIKRRVLWAHV